MKRLTIFAVLILSTAALGQNGINCETLWQTENSSTSVCSASVNGTTTYYKHELDTDHASETEISFDQYSALLKAYTADLEARTKMLQTPAPIMSDPSAPMERVMSVPVTVPRLDPQSVPSLSPESIHNRKACGKAGYVWHHGTCTAPTEAK